MDVCKHHEMISEKLKRYEKHCDESDEPQTGYRDRHNALEAAVAVMVINIEKMSKSIQELKRTMWRLVFVASMVGGIVGAFFAQCAPEVIGYIAKKVLG